MLKQEAQTLTAIFSDVLANLAFMFTEDDLAESAPGEIWIETEIRYEGPECGTLLFRCARDFCVLLAANLLGVDAENDAAATQSEDAVKEFMNIICGQFVTATFGSDDVYNLSIPVTRELPQSPDLELGHGEPFVSTLSVDGFRVQLAHVPESRA